MENPAKSFTYHYFSLHQCSAISPTTPKIVFLSDRGIPEIRTNFGKKLEKKTKKTFFSFWKKMFLPKCHSGHVKCSSDNSAGNFWLSETLSCNNLIFQQKAEAPSSGQVECNFDHLVKIYRAGSPQKLFFQKTLAATFPPTTLKLYSFCVIFRLDKPLQTLFAANLNIIFTFSKEIFILKYLSRLLKCIFDNLAQLFSFKLWQNFRVFPKSISRKKCFCRLFNFFGETSRIL